MPKHIIEGPDGQRHVIEAPDGARPEDVMAFFQQKVGGQRPQPSAPQPQEPAAAMSWGDVSASAVRNIPKSAQELGQSVFHAVTHPVETVKAVADVGYGGLSKAASAVGVPMDPQAKAEREKSFDAVSDFFAERYGGVENFKKTLAEDPVGFAADLSVVLSGGAALPSRLPGTAGKVAQTVGNVGRAIDPLGAAGRGVVAAGRNVVEPLVTNSVGLLSGAGAEPLRTAYRAGAEGNQAFAPNMRGQASLNESVDMANNALGQMRKERAAAYQANMQGAKSSTLLLDDAPMLKAINDAHDMTHFNGVSKSAEASKVLDDIVAKVKEFQSQMPRVQYKRPEGMDALKQAIGEIRQKTQPGTLERRVADSVYHSIKNEIVRQVPEYGKAMDDYSTASDRINDIAKTFSLSEKAAPDTTARKLASVMRNNVNTNYGTRTRLMEDLAAYEPDLPFALAGQQLSSSTPRGMAGHAAIGQAGLALATFNPAFLATLAASSPRLMGEAYHAAGKGARMAGEASKKTGITSRRLAETMLGLYQSGEIEQALRGGSGPRYDEFGNPR